MSSPFTLGGDEEVCIFKKEISNTSVLGSLRLGKGSKALLSNSLVSLLDARRERGVAFSVSPGNSETQGARKSSVSVFW